MKTLLIFICALLIIAPILNRALQSYQENRFKKKLKQKREKYIGKEVLLKDKLYKIERWDYDNDSYFLDNGESLGYECIQKIMKDNADKKESKEKET
jgi:hypothetical protein